jgi:hypothetical protein
MSMTFGASPVVHAPGSHTSVNFGNPMATQNPFMTGSNPHMSMNYGTSPVVHNPHQSMSFNQNPFMSNTNVFAAPAPQAGVEIHHPQTAVAPNPFMSQVQNATFSPFAPDAQVCLQQYPSY